MCSGLLSGSKSLAHTSSFTVIMFNILLCCLVSIFNFLVLLVDMFMGSLVLCCFLAVLSSSTVASWYDSNSFLAQNVFH